MRDHYRRWAWLGVLVIGLVLYMLVLRTLVRTQNPNFVPALILLGATVVPLAFLTFAQARTGRWQVPAWALVTSAFFGGVIGTVVAGTLEYDTLRGLGALPMLFVALIEESAKLIVPVVLLLTVLARHQRRLPSDGLIIGVAAGMGFAAKLGREATSAVPSGVVYMSSTSWSWPSPGPDRMPRKKASRTGLR